MARPRLRLSLPAIDCTRERCCAISVSRSAAMGGTTRTTGSTGRQATMAALMGTFRSLSRDDVREILTAFGLDPGQYTGHHPIAAGTINTNVAVDTSAGRLFLRINEGKARQDVEPEAAIVPHVAAGGGATPAPLRTPQGVPFLAWGGSYVSVFPWVPGRVLARAEVTPG